MTLKTLLISAGIAVALASGSALVAYQKGVGHGEQAIQSKWDKERLEVAQAHAKELEAALNTSRDLQARLDTQRKAHRNEITRITRAHAAVVDGLRDRPDAPSPSGVSGDPGPGIELTGWCTGAQLYRDHAGAFAGEAALAAQLQAALGTCISAYDEIRRSMTEKK